METLPNFTPRVQQALSVAKELAKASFTRTINLDHVFLGVLGLQTGFLGDFFHKHGIEVGDLSHSLTEDLARRLTKNQNSEEGTLEDKYEFDPTVKSVLAIASLAAEKMKHEYVGLEHLLLALLKHKRSPLLAYLTEIGKDPGDLLGDLKSLFRDEAPSVAPLDREWRRASPTPPFPAKDPLDAYTVNFNKLALDGRLDSVIGKEKELADMAEILCRRKKNNPILLGSAGVGKTALVEGLAQQIVSGQCVDFLLPKVIYGLDLAALIAGTKYRGQFEERLQKIVTQLKKNENAIIFIDELHTLVGAGSAEGTLDAANILKPTLARGEITCIGATTTKEYKKNIEKDAALSRRFQSVKIKEPTEQETVQILQGIKHKYEDFHGVRYTPPVLKLIVDLAARYIPDRHMPDKAIDILDQAASRRKLIAFQRPPAAKELEAKLNASLDTDPITNEEEHLFDQYKEILDQWAEQVGSIIPQVTEKDIIDVVAAKTGVSREMLRPRGSHKFLRLEKALKQRVIGQDKAIATTAQAILRGQTGLGDPNKPLGTFLFLGPSGVGKTYTAKALADQVFGGVDNLIQINMSEYSEKISSSRLIGAAPGYIGYDESGQLTEKVRTKPYSLVLFDEIEKAHDEVTNLLLQILEEGKITDNFGRDINFANTIVIATGNIGVGLFKKGTSVGFGAVNNEESRNKAILEEAKKLLRPELLNRFTETVIFNELEADSLTEIIKLEIKSLQKRVKKVHDIRLVVTKSLLNFLGQRGSEQKDGARVIKTLIKKEIENTLAEALTKEDCTAVTKVTLSRPKNETIIKVSY